VSRRAQEAIAGFPPDPETGRGSFGAGALAAASPDAGSTWQGHWRLAAAAGDNGRRPTRRLLAWSGGSVGQAGMLNDAGVRVIDTEQLCNCGGSSFSVAGGLSGIPCD